MTEIMSIDDIFQACLRMSLGQEREFTLNRDWGRLEMARLAGRIVEGRRNKDGLGVGFNRSERTVTAQCHLIPGTKWSDELRRAVPIRLC